MQGSSRTPFYRTTIGRSPELFAVTLTTHSSKNVGDLSPNVSVFTGGVTKVLMPDADRNCLAGV